MGHSFSHVSFSPPLLPFHEHLFKIQHHITEHFTLLKASLPPPPPQPLVSDVETQVICHQRGVLEETASPAWELHTGPNSALGSAAELLNIVKQSSSRDKDEAAVSMLATGCHSLWLVFSLRTGFYHKDRYG